MLEIAALIVLAAATGFVGLAFRQPMVVSFIAAGVLAGPAGLGILQSHDQVALLAELGIALLLFMVGMKLDLELVRSLGGVALATGLGQVLFTSVLGFGIGLALGFDAVTALYVAVALTFSSTIIIVKLLSDKKEIDSLHGKIALGFLIVQDLVVVLALMALSAIGIGQTEGDDGSGFLRVMNVLLYGVVLLFFVGLFIRYVATPLVGRLARSPELLVTFAIGWATLFAALGDFIGFSKELGGLLAGVSLASTPYREALYARLSTLRDFLLLFFFLTLGLFLDLGSIGKMVLPALVFSLFVLVGNPLIVMGIMGSMGYRKRTGFMAGLTVAQISEFSLIFMAMGLTLGHVAPEAVGMVTLVGLITIALSVYMIIYSNTLYRWLEPFLGVFERRVATRESMLAEGGSGRRRHDVVLFGLGRYGSALAQQLLRLGYRVLAVDFDPETVRRWQSAGFDVVFGDAGDADFVATLPLQDTKCVVSAISQHDLGLTHEDPRILLLETLRGLNYQGIVAVSVQRAHDVTEVEILQKKGADLVFQPYLDAAEQAALQLNEALERGAVVA